MPVEFMIIYYRQTAEPILLKHTGLDHIKLVVQKTGTSRDMMNMTINLGIDLQTGTLRSSLYADGTAMGFLYMAFGQCVTLARFRT